MKLSKVFIEAQKSADMVRAEADKQAEELKADSQKLSDNIITEANNKAAKIVYAAEKQAAEIEAKAYNDDEARLCYVAATRARDFLIWAKMPPKRKKKSKVVNWE